MLVEVKVPQLSESVAEATLLSWHKKVGDAVARDENLIDIETDKVVLELPAPAGGVITQIVKADGGTNFIVMVSAASSSLAEVERVPLTQTNVFLKAECDFKNRADKAHFFYSLDGKSWIAIGNQLKMSYTLPHFMGYRFGLFNFATKTPGGYADFDYFRVSDKIQ